MAARRDRIMSEGGVRLPGFWRFLWLLFMQPITLHRLLRSVSIKPEDSVWKLLWRQRSREENWWLQRSTQTVFLFTPAVVLLSSLLAFAAGAHIDWLIRAMGVTLGVTLSAAL